MKGIVLRWLILTVAIMFAAYLIQGIEVRGFGSALFAAALLGILNAFFRPILIILTLPINILTLGLFTFVINALLLMMASGVIGGFEVHGFWAAFFGSLVISLVSWLLSSFVNERGRVGYIDLKRRDDGKWERKG
jgi:putative membrane protein